MGALQHRTLIFHGGPQSSEKEEKLLDRVDIIKDEAEEEKKETVEPSQNGDSAEEVGRRDSMK